MSRSYDSMIKKLHSALKIDNLWPQFLEALSVELDSYLIAMDLVRNYKNSNFDYEHYFDSGFQQSVYQNFINGGYSYSLYDSTQETIYRENMERLAQKYGYIPNTIIDNTTAFLKKELQTIAYRIKNKTTYDGYLFPIRQISRSGEVYNFIYNDDKLVKNVLWGTENGQADSILKWYASHTPADFILPFSNIYSDVGYSSVIDYSVILDTNRTLDETSPWYLDGKKFPPTKHLGIEYYIDQIVSKETVKHLIYSDYFRYLEQACDYNRHINVVTHTGASLNFVTPPSQAYNFFDNSKFYTIPALELKAQTSFNIENKTLSSARYISVGSGTHTIPSIDDSSIFTKIASKFSYSLQAEGTTVKDLSGTLNAVLVGEVLPVDGIFGKEINFDGATYVLSNSDFSTVDGDYTLTGWFKYSETTNTEDCILDCGFIKITLNSVSKQLKVYCHGTLKITYSLLGQNPQDNIVFFAITYVATTDVITLFINGTSIGSGSYIFNFDASRISFGVSLINSLTPSNDFFKGIISNVCLLNKILTNSEILSIFTNDLTFSSNVSNRLYRSAISVDERIASDNWTGVNTYVPSFSINEKTLFQYKSPTTSYSGSVGNTIVPNTFKIQYTDTKNDFIFDQQVTDDGAGFIKNEVMEGTIDYTTGNYNLTLYKIHDSTYFKAVQNEIKIVLSNTNHVFPYSNTGVINYFGSGTEIMVWEGNTQLIADQTASYGNGTFRVISTKATNIKLGTLSGDGTATLTYGNCSQLSGEYADIVYTIVVKNKQGIETTYEKVQQFSKSLNSKSAKIVATNYAFTYNEGGTLPSPSSTIINATSFNMNSPIYYEFLIDGISQQNSTSTYIVYTPPTNINSLPQTIEVRVREKTNNSAVVATDIIEISGVQNSVIGSSFYTSLLADIGHTNINIVPKSVKINYQIKDSYYYTTDNGNDSGTNNIFGIALQGIIDYDTGEITLSTTNDPSNNPYQLQSLIQISFQYKKYTNLVEDSCFYTSYKTRDNIKITELAIEDENKQAFVYATFPPIEFNSLENYLAVNIMLPIVS